MSTVPHVDNYSDLLDEDLSDPRIAQVRFEAMAGGVAAMLPNQRSLAEIVPDLLDQTNVNGSEQLPEPTKVVDIKTKVPQPNPDGSSD